MAKTVFLLEKIQDSGDVERLRKALTVVEGVRRVEVELVKNQVIVEHDEELASVEALCLRLDHIGLTPILV